MEILDQKHFTNNLTKAMNGPPINSETGTQESQENIIKNIICNYKIFTDYKRLINLNNLDDFRPTYLQEQINPDCNNNNNNYFKIDVEEKIWNGVILKVYFKEIFYNVPLYPKYRDNENVLAPKVYKLNNIFNYYAIEKMFLLFVTAKLTYCASRCLHNKAENTKCIIKPSAPQLNIYLLTIDLPDFRNALDSFPEHEKRIKRQQSPENTVNRKYSQPIGLEIEILDNCSLYKFVLRYFMKGKDMIFIENTLINFLKILLDSFAPTKKYKIISNLDEKSVSPIHNNWFIQDFLHGFLLAILQKRCKINILYYTSKQYFVIINRHTCNIIIEIKMFKSDVFNICNYNLYQKICNWKAKTNYDARIAIYNNISLKEVISVILNLYNFRIMSSVLNKETNEVIKVKQISGYKPMQSLDINEHIKVNEVLSDYVISEKSEFLLKSESDSELMMIVQVEEIISETKALTHCKSNKSIKSENLLHRTKSITDCASINTVETDEFTHESISPCESIKTLESDDHIDELKFLSDIESLKTILSKSSTFSQQKTNESTWLKCVSSSETDDIYLKTQFRKLNSDKLIDNIYKENLTIYNDNYLHSKYWLKKLFKEPENNTQVEKQNALLCCRQSEEGIINKTYRSYISLKNDMSQLYQQNYSQTFNDFYEKNQFTLRFQTSSFCKYLGQSLVQIFCNVIL